MTPFLGRPRLITEWIVYAMAAIYVLQLFLPVSITPWLSLTPRLVWHNGFIWQPLTYVFVHGSVLHFVFEALFLWLAGRQIESLWGTRAYAILMALAALGTAAFLLILAPTSGFSLIGAAGPLLALMVALAMTAPDAEIRAFFFFPMRMWHAAALFAFIEFAILFEATRSFAVALAPLAGMGAAYAYIRHGGGTGRWIFQPFRRIAAWWSERRPRVQKKRPEFHEVTDDLAREVDRILDKVLKSGVESLTTDEKAIMDRYARRKT